MPATAEHSLSTAAWTYLAVRSHDFTRIGSIGFRGGSGGSLMSSSQPGASANGVAEGSSSQP